MADVDFAPSQVDMFARSLLPFIDTFKRAEIEMGAALLVAAMAHHGNKWQALEPRQTGTWLEFALESKPAPWDAVFSNPFAPQPDMVSLVEHGWARWVDDGREGTKRPLEFTDAFFARLVEKGWVCRA